MKKFLDKYALALSMVIGVVGFPVFRHLMPFLPPMIFLMLFFTFCKINPMDLRLHSWHWIMLACQLLLSVATYYALILLTGNEAIAQGLMVCLIMPTATAAPIIAGKLGGSIQNLTSFTMLSNVATAIVVPAFFPIVNPGADMTFWMASLLILRKVGPLLLGPFFTAWAMRLIYDAVERRRGTNRTFHMPRSLVSMPFYLWAGTLIVLMSDITYSMLYGSYSGWTVVALFAGALITCVAQFFLGKAIGQRWPAAAHGEDYREEAIGVENLSLSQVSRVTAGQAFGQKNTTLGVWMAQTYLCPLAALGPAAYIIWQNVFNSWQLVRAAKGKRI